LEPLLAVSVMATDAPSDAPAHTVTATDWPATEKTAFEQR
jgi:hypothetical protein